MTVYEILENNKKNTPERIAYTQIERDGNTTVSYEELADKVVNYAAYYQTLESTRIGILGVNSVEWIFNVLGAIVAGDKTVALLDPQMPAEDMTILCKRCGLELIVCDSELEELAAEVSAENR